MDLPRLITPSHLTDVLRRSGALVRGHVTHVEVAHGETTFLSQAVRLRLRYEGADGAVPATLFLKAPPPDNPAAAARPPREVAFYQGAGALKPLPVMARCHEAHRDLSGNGWHILLEDLADTHALATGWPLPPTQAQCERMVRALARFHAAWWEDAALGTQVGFRPDGERMTAWADRLQVRFGQFAEQAGEWLSPERRRLFERLIDAAPRVLAYGHRRPMTVIHGDAHLWNCFLAKPGTGAEDKWFDWDNSRVDLGASDLAYMMAVHWYPERRRRFEQPLLDAYHAALCEAGVAGYSRADLRDDYRLGLLRQMSTPVWQQGDGIPDHVWWNHFERVFLAAEDLDCFALV